MSQNLQKIAKFQKIQLDNLVDFEKCCKTRICLQRSMPIQPKSIENLPKILPRRSRPAARRRRPSRCSRPWSTTAQIRTLAGLSKFGKFCIFFCNFANFWRARSRLNQNEILQGNMRLKASFKLHKVCILLHRCNLKMLAI